MINFIERVLDSYRSRVDYIHYIVYIMFNTISCFVFNELNAVESGKTFCNIFINNELKLINNQVKE